MESTLEEITVLSRRDITAALDAMTTRSSNQLTGTVITSVRIRLGTITAYWPSQQIIKIPTREQVGSGISARPEGRREREFE